ncbi:hypothetical protein DFH09DRAFT_1272839 [Mycena vulgaris]|nr:hypothetical protein DFH09DRAFT_1272839 [Mycena vulgaris]
MDLAEEPGADRGLTALEGVVSGVEEINITSHRRGDGYTFHHGVGQSSAEPACLERLQARGGAAIRQAVCDAVHVLICGSLSAVETGLREKHRTPPGTRSSIGSAAIKECRITIFCVDDGMHARARLAVHSASRPEFSETSATTANVPRELCYDACPSRPVTSRSFLTPRSSLRPCHVSAPQHQGECARPWPAALRSLDRGVRWRARMTPARARGLAGGESGTYEASAPRPRARTVDDATVVEGASARAPGACCAERSVAPTPSCSRSGGGRRAPGKAWRGRCGERARPSEGAGTRRRAQKRLLALARGCKSDEQRGAAFADGAGGTRGEALCPRTRGDALRDAADGERGVWGMQVRASPLDQPTACLCCAHLRAHDSDMQNIDGVPQSIGNECGELSSAPGEEAARARYFTWACSRMARERVGDGLCGRLEWGGSGSPVVHIEAGAEDVVPRRSKTEMKNLHLYRVRSHQAEYQALDSGPRLHTSPPLRSRPATTHHYRALHRTT